VLLSDHTPILSDATGTPPKLGWNSLFHPNFGGVPVASDGPCWGQPEQRP